MEDSLKQDVAVDGQGRETLKACETLLYLCWVIFYHDFLPKAISLSLILLITNCY